MNGQTTEKEIIKKEEKLNDSSQKKYSEEYLNFVKENFKIKKRIKPMR